MNKPKITEHPTSIISNTLPLTTYGKKMQQGVSYGLSMNKTAENLTIAVMVSYNISQEGGVLYEFKTVKQFIVEGELDEGAITHLSCDLMTGASKESNAKLKETMGIQFLNIQYPIPTLKQLYPIAAGATKMFIDGTDKFPTFNN